MKVGEVVCAEGPIVLNAGRKVREVAVTNKGDRPVQVGSHCHFFEVNRCLSFDRAAAFGYRLDVPSGNSVRFEPGEEKIQARLRGQRPHAGRDGAARPAGGP